MDVLKRILMSVLQVEKNEDLGPTALHEWDNR